MDKIHNDICETLMLNYKDIKVKDTNENAFSYGNAQKWVNMTMKYLYVIGNVFLNSEVNNDFVANYAEKIKPWSRWDEKEYIDFWKYLSSLKKSPIEWEGPAWIKIAQKRNKQ